MAEDDQLPDVHFGSVEEDPKKKRDWRKHVDPLDKVDNDKLLLITPNYVTQTLGFDPRELDDDNDGDDE